MLTARDLSYGLYGAWRLAILDRGAMQYFDATIEGYWKSFYAAAIVAPAFIIMTAFSVVQTDLPAHIGVLDIVLVQTTRYVISWVAFPLLMTTVSDVMQRGERYTGFIVAFNWAQVVEMAIVLPVFLIVAASGLPADEPNTVYTMLFFAIAFYYWFIARTALEISGWAAGAVVIVNFTVSGGIELASLALLR